MGYTEKAKEEVCITNCLQLERMYDEYLSMEEIEHSNVVFSQYMQENYPAICPDDGDISYEDDRVRCSIHYMEDQN